MPDAAPEATISLDEASILRAVREASGVANLREDGLGDRLRRLLAHLDQDLGLDPTGRAEAFASVCELLTSRTLMLEDRTRHPEIADEVVKAPLIVTGLPRSGTTLMHALLAADSRNRAPRYWEVVRPSPPPGISPADDPRIASADGEVADFCRRQPMILLSHPYFDRGAGTIMECESFATPDLRNLYNTYFYRIPAVLWVDLEDDPLAAYHYHRQVLQALQWKREPKRWALKGTEHHAHLDTLKETYPDAKLVWIHRDPLKIIPSLMELLSGWFEGVLKEPVDRPTFGRQVFARYKAMLDAALASPMVDHPDICHVLYADFAADPIETIGKVYERFGIPFPAETASAMRDWQSDPKNQGDRHGRFRYSLADFDMTRDELEAEMAPYRRHFDIPFEGRPA